MAKNFDKLIFGGLHEKHAVQRGIWVPTQHSLWDQGKPRKTLIELAFWTLSIVNNVYRFVRIPHKERVPAQSPFHKQLTEKRKDSRLFHLSASKKTSIVSL
jgi:hypothetical protein